MDLTTTVSRIVLDHPRCAAVFQDRHIDFSCGGGLTLAEACTAQGLDAAEVAFALDKAASLPALSDDPGMLSTTALVSLVLARHHTILREGLPFLVPLVAKVARVHGDHDPRLRELQAEFSELLELLDLHLDQEDEERLLREVATDGPDAGHLQSKLAVMREEHREVWAALRRIRVLSDDHTPPAWACNSYRKLLAELRHLENDVLHHIHLENEVLLLRLTPGSVH